jgi:predicted Zn-dependent peptidase
VLDEHLPLAVDLLTDILLHPLFNADELEREKSVVLQEIKMVEDTPDDIIHDLFAGRSGRVIPSAGPSSAAARR